MNIDSIMTYVATNGVNLVIKVAAAIAIWVIGRWLISLFMVGSHYGVTSIISGFYPSEIRANGTGWCSGVAKIGSVLGPVIGGYILAPHVLPNVRVSYALLAVCPTVYGIAILSIGLIERRGRRRLAPAAKPAPAAAE